MKRRSKKELNLPKPEEIKPDWYYTGDFSGAFPCHPEADIDIVESRCSISLDASVTIRCHVCRKVRDEEIAPSLYYGSFFRYNKNTSQWM